MSPAALSRRTFLLSGTAASLAIATGCSSSSSNKPAAQNKANDKVTYLTGFGTSPREEYVQIGIAKGYFRDAGIEVTVQPGQPSDANLKALQAGQAQFASIDYVSAVRGVGTWADSSGQPNYRVVASVQKSTLLSMITLSTTGIVQPVDLIGKTLGAAPNAASQTLFPTYAKLAGIDPTKVKFENGPSDQLPTLLASNKVQAIGSYSVDAPNITAAAKAATKDANVKAVALPYSAYITDLYGTVLITAASLASSNPDLVKRFTTALMKGVKYAVNNASEAATIIKGVVPATNVEGTTEVYKLMAPYVGDGELEPAKVMRGIALLEGANMIKPGLTPDKLVAFDLAPAKAA
jgi:NitT/TauT family transport system substrate-binding protein